MKYTACHLVSSVETTRYAAIRVFYCCTLDAILGIDQVMEFEVADNRAFDISLVTATNSDDIVIFGPSVSGLGGREVQ